MSGVAVQVSVETEGQDSAAAGVPANSVPASSVPAARAADVPYSVRLEFFSGPMDLLLHLVARQEVPIEEISMSMIAEQYLQIVSAEAEYGDGQGLDLEQASEYLVIAATLMAIKSRSLLPTDDELEEDLGDWNEENPFFEDLRERLKAYKVTQVRAKALRFTPQLGVHTFSRRDRKALQPTPEMLAEPEDVHSLGAMFVAMIKRIGDSAGYTIAAQPVSVVTFMVRIVDSLGDRVRKLAGRGRVAKTSFVELLAVLSPVAPKPSEEGGVGSENRNRLTVIGGFVAVLELMKRGLLSAEVDENSFSVELTMSTDNQVSTDEFSSEFDEQPESAGELEEGDLEDDELDIVDHEDSEKIIHMDRYRKAG